MKIKYRKWIQHEINEWHKIGIIDTQTMDKIGDYYIEKEKQQDRQLGPILGVLGCILIALGTILILAKNWSFLPRGAKVSLSFVPFLIGSFSGMLIIKNKRSKWLKEAAAFFTSIGILTAVVMSGQIYHIIIDEWMIFLIIAFLSIPLVYLYDSTLTLAFYFIIGSICMFTTNLDSLWLKIALGILIIGVSIPYVNQCYKKGKMHIETGWANAFLALAGFAFITSLNNTGVLLRELYLLYFIILVSLDALIYEEAVAFGTRPFAVLGNVGLYITLFIFTFKEFWRFIDISRIGWEYMIVILALLGIGIGIITWLVRKKRHFSKRIMIYFIAASVLIFCRILGFLQADVTLPLTIVLNGFFIILALMTLKEGLNYDNQAQMNMGLLLLGLVTMARFFDGEFSFLVKGIAFIVCGAVFLLANMYLMKKRKKELRNNEAK